MLYRSLADLVVVVHFAVVIFVILGGVLVVRWPRVAWVHLPIVAWVIFAEWFHRICPLTFLENWFLSKAGMEAYRQDFVSHYIVPMLYPQGLTQRIQVLLGTSLFLINAVLYAVAFRPARHAPAQPGQQS